MIYKKGRTMFGRDEQTVHRQNRVMKRYCLALVSPLRAWEPVYRHKRTMKNWCFTGRVWLQKRKCRAFHVWGRVKGEL